MLRKKERELEDAEERHQMEMRIYRQKVKHMLFEQNSKEADLKKETSVTLNAMSDEMRIEVRALQNENYTLKAQLRYRQLESEEAIKMLKRQHETEMTNIRQEFIVQSEEMEQRHAKQAAMLREELETKRRSEIHATEERKNMHIKQLEVCHDKAFTGMKSYYNDVTLGNVNVIKTLRDNIEELRSNLIRTQKKLDASAAETEMHREKLRQMESQNKNLLKIALQYDTEKAAHSVTKHELQRTLKTKKSFEMQVEVLQARLEILEKNRDSLANTMEQIMLGIKQKSGLRCMILEKKLAALVSTLESREAQVDHMVMAMNADPAAVKDAKQHLEELLQRKNQAIRELQYEVTRIGKAYNDLWSACHAKMLEELSSPVNLGIKPVQVDVALISPFNPATAQAKLLKLEDQQAAGTPSAVNIGKGPVGLTSIAPL
ncbi:Dynein regulatory complex subunit 4 [Sparganum proliferum]